MKMYILTGGPCTGKTTLARELGKHGYTTLDESARLVMSDQDGKPNPIYPWTDLETFQGLVAVKQMSLEERATSDTFLDRGLIDGLAYCRLAGITPPRELQSGIERRLKDKSYKAVFLLEPLPYINDSQRREDPEHAKRIHSAIEQTYSSLGYRLIKVPAISKEERTEMILAHVALGGVNDG